MDPQRPNRHFASPAVTRSVDVRFAPVGLVAPARQLGIRVLVGLFVLTLVTVTVMLDRDGYHDARDGMVSVPDALYYATVTITTTGYGDIVPATDAARAVTTYVVTPARIAFLVLLVGTSLELIASATRTGIRRNRWRKKVQGHIVIAGYGVKGRAALVSLEQQGVRGSQIVVVDRDGEVVDAAVRDGHIGIQGDMTSNAVLDAAMVGTADVVVVTPTRDDTAVLTVLSARLLNPRVRVVAAARELENAELLRQSGADVVLTSSGATGQMLGLATMAPHAIEVLEDLLEVRHGFDLVERRIDEASSGELASSSAEGEVVLAVFRHDELVVRAPERSFTLEPGDSVVSIVCREPVGA